MPALPGLVTQGDTLEEARVMATDAILGYLEALQKDGEPIPDDTPLKLEPVKEKDCSAATGSDTVSRTESIKVETQS